MRAILIDPVARQVTQVVIENSLEAYYRVIRCETIEAAYPEQLPDFDHLYVDDEGLFKDDQSFFTIAGYEQPLASRALVVGGNADGETVDAVSPLLLIKLRVRFIP